MTDIGSVMGNLKQGLLLLTGAFLLTGCTQLAPKPLQPTQTATDFSARSLRDQGLHDFLSQNAPGVVQSLPQTVWSPDALIVAALYFHPDLEVARAHWEATRAAVMTAAQRPNPGLSLAPLYNASSSGSSPWTVPVNVALPIETAGKRDARIQQAEQLLQEEGWKIRETAWRIRQRVQNRMLEVQSVKETIKLLEEQLIVQDELVKRLRAWLDTGAISPFEWVQTRSTAQALRLSLLQAKRQRLEVHARLAGAIGIPLSALNQAKLRYTSLDREVGPVLLSEARQAALKQRADIIGMLARYQAAEAALRIQIARQYPNISIGPGYEFDQGENKWGLGFALELPLLNRNQGPIAEAEAYRTEVATEFRALQARIIGEVEQRFSAYQAQQDIISAAAELLTLSIKQEQRIRLRKSAGDLSVLDELRARTETLNAERKVLDARVQRMQTFYDLENVLQSPAELPMSVSRQTSNTSMSH